MAAINPRPFGITVPIIRLRNGVVTQAISELRATCREEQRAMMDSKLCMEPNVGCHRLQNRLQNMGLLGVQ